MKKNIHKKVFETAIDSMVVVFAGCAIVLMFIGTVYVAYKGFTAIW